MDLSDGFWFEFGRMLALFGVGVGASVAVIVAFILITRGGRRGP